MPSPESDIPVLKPGLPLAYPEQPQPKADDTTRRLWESVSPATVQIVTNRGAGSGFFVDDKGDVVTDAHVVLGANEFYAITTDGTRYKAKLEKLDDLHDLAQLHLENFKQGSQPHLSFASSTNLSAEQPIYALGNSLGLRPDYISPGSFVSQLPAIGLVAEGSEAEQKKIAMRLAHLTPSELDDVDKELKRSLLEARIHVEPGNSGGPVVNQDGKVIGVTAMLDVQQRTRRAFLNPAEDVLNLLNSPSKYEFSYSYQPNSWVKSYEHSLSQNTLTTLAETGLLGGAGGYLAYKATARFPKAVGAAVGLWSLQSLAKDTSNFLSTVDERDKEKSGLKVLSDVTSAAGAVASFFPQTRTLGMIAMSAGLLGRAGTEFIPNHLILTDIKRTDGSNRPPMVPDFAIAGD